MADKIERKTLIEVYDPAMCCSTGVCGSDVDDSLADFANDVKWLKLQEVDVKRYNLGQEPEAFKMNPHVLERLKKDGAKVLPLIFINGKMVPEGGYPDRSALTNWIDLDRNNGTVLDQGNKTMTADELPVEHSKGCAPERGCC